MYSKDLPAPPTYFLHLGHTSPNSIPAGDQAYSVGTGYKYLPGRDVTAKVTSRAGRLSSQVPCTSRGDLSLIPSTPHKKLSVVVPAWNPSARRQ